MYKQNEIKSLNLEMTTKLVESKRTVQVKEEMIAMLESKVSLFISKLRPLLSSLAAVKHKSLLMHFMLF